jgi:hypothetical protein
VPNAVTELLCGFERFVQKVDGVHDRVLLNNGIMNSAAIISAWAVEREAGSSIEPDDRSANLGSG